MNLFTFMLLDWHFAENQIATELLATPYGKSPVQFIRRPCIKTVLKMFYLNCNHIS